MNGEENRGLETAGIGVYICRCGGSIAGEVDCDLLAEYAAGLPNVTVARQIGSACSREGQALIRGDILAQGLSRVVVAACTPLIHSETFAGVLKEADLSPSLIAVANIREQCAWAHPGGRERATGKAIDLVTMAVARASHLRERKIERLPVQPRALVIGGGIAGIQTALDLAGSGHPVTLVEKEPSLGGLLSRLDRIFPGMESPLCVLGLRMAEVEKHPEIELLAGSSVEDVAGEAGNYAVKIILEPRHVTEACTSCGACLKVCPVEVPNARDAGFSSRKAIYPAGGVAVSPAYVIDRKACLGINGGACDACVRACPEKAIDLGQEPRGLTREAGAIVLATGMEPSDPAFLEDYGYIRFENVITSLEFETLVRPDGPTGGQLVRLSDSKPPGSVAFIQCAGSQSVPKGWAGGGSLTWMNTLKESLIIKERWPGTEVYIFYTEMQVPGKSHEDLYARARGSGVRFIRGLPAEIVEAGERRLKITGENTLLRELYRIEVALVVLASGFVPTRESERLRRLLRVQTDPSGYLLTSHPALKPLEGYSRAVFGAGTALGPRDVRESIITADAAAARASSFLRQGEIERDARYSPDRPDEEISVQIEALASNEAEKKVLVLACSGAYQAIDLAGALRLAYPVEVFVIETGCAGSVSRKHLLQALGRGIGAVIVAGCEPEECLFREAGEAARERIMELKETLEELGVTAERLRWADVSTRDPGAFVSAARETARFINTIPSEKLREESKIVAESQHLEKPSGPLRRDYRRKAAEAAPRVERPEVRLEGLLRREVLFQPVERKIFRREEEMPPPLPEAPAPSAETLSLQPPQFYPSPVEEEPASFAESATEDSRGEKFFTPTEAECPPIEVEGRGDACIAPTEPPAMLDLIPEPMAVFINESTAGVSEKKAGQTEGAVDFLIRPIPFELPEEEELPPMDLPEVEPFPEEVGAKNFSPLPVEDEAALSFLQDLKGDLELPPPSDEIKKPSKSAVSFEELPDDLKAFLDTEVFIDDSVVEVSLEEVEAKNASSLPEEAAIEEPPLEEGKEEPPASEEIALEVSEPSGEGAEEFPLLEQPTSAIIPVRKSLLLPVKPPVMGWRRGKLLPVKPLPGPFGLGRFSRGASGRGDACVAHCVGAKNVSPLPEEAKEVPLEDLLILRVPERK
ncbi:MAG: FAD-dependent oxidoreductase [bacterium]